VGGVGPCRVALGFLTALPLGPPPKGAWDLRRAAPCFPWVGALLGALFYLAAHLFWALFPPGVAGALLLGLWLLFTGMLHLDGLLDAADALLLPADRERRLDVLKDPRVGAFALGAGAVYLLAKAQALAALGPHPALVAAPALARFFVLPASRLPAARPGGLGAGIRGTALGAALLPALAVAFFFPVPALVAALGTALFYRLALARLGGVTGDLHGAAIELAELFFLLGALAAGV